MMTSQGPQNLTALEMQREKREGKQKREQKEKWDRHKIDIRSIQDRYEIDEIDIRWDLIPDLQWILESAVRMDPE